MVVREPVLLTFYRTWRATYDDCDTSEHYNEKLEIQFFTDSFHLTIINWGDTLYSQDQPCNVRRWENYVRGYFSGAVNVLHLDGVYVDSTFTDSIANPECEFFESGQFSAELSMSVCKDQGSSYNRSGDLPRKHRMTWVRIR